MKNKSFLMMLVAIICASGFGWTFVSAELDDTIHDLEPVLYDKLKFKKNTDYLHDGKKIEMKNTIPVKQIDINFDGSKKLPTRSDTSYLFQTAEREKKSTIPAKTSELGLFAKDKKVENTKIVGEMNKEEPVNNNKRTFIFIAIIAVGLLILFVFFLPRLVTHSVQENRK